MPRQPEHEIIGRAEEYRGKTYLVPGGSSGIGFCASRKLAQMRANIIIIARNEAKLKAALANLTPGRHKGIAFDVSDVDSISEQIAELRKEYEKIDGMLYCVGNGVIARLRDLNYQSLHGIMLSNFYAWMEYARALSSQKKKTDRLSIVGISSLASSIPEKYYTAYSASKAAMESATRCLALELCGRNTTINLIRPGIVDTERLAYLNEMTGDLDTKIRESGFQPMGLIPVEDVADMAVYLLGNAARYINGVSVPINGAAF